MLRKKDIEEGDYIVLQNGIHCRVSKAWHGKNKSWIEGSYRNRAGATVIRSIELTEIKEIAPEPYTDPK